MYLLVILKQISVLKDLCLTTGRLFKTLPIVLCIQFSSGRFFSTCSSTVDVNWDCGSFPTVLLVDVPGTFQGRLIDWNWFEWIGFQCFQPGQLRLVVPPLDPESQRLTSGGAFKGGPCLALLLATSLFSSLPVRPVRRLRLCLLLLRPFGVIPARVQTERLASVLSCSLGDDVLSCLLKEAEVPVGVGGDVLAPPPWATQLRNRSQIRELHREPHYRPGRFIEAVPELKPRGGERAEQKGKCTEPTNHQPAVVEHPLKTL